MKLYSLRRGFLHRVHCRRLSPLSTRMRSLRRELLFGRCATETSSWIRPLVLKRNASFDHLVGAQQERLGDRQAQRLGGRQINGEVELGRLLDRDVARLRTTQNFIDITSSAPEKVQKVRSIGHQTSRFDPLSGIV